MPLILPNLATCKKIGFIVPSSNTGVEPITNAIFSSLPRDANVIPLFTRLGVTHVGTDSNTASQFSTQNFIAAARLLADAGVHAILWNGTSGMWLGDLHKDRELAQAMEDATGIPCSTNTLATIDALATCRVQQVAIAVPYNDHMTSKCCDFFTQCGYEVVGSARLPEVPASNIEIAKSGIDEIADVVKRAATPRSLAVIVACTNWPAAAIVEKLESETEKVMLDSIVVSAWKGLRMVGFSGEVEGWGKLMKML